jgi:hypothetical protein
VKALFLALGLALPQDLGTEAFVRAPVEAAVRAADLEATVRYLASDGMRGRATGSAELMVASDGVARRLSSAGLAGGGDEGGFLQRVPLVTLRPTQVPRLTLVLAGGERREAVWGVDFDGASGLLEASALGLAVAREGEAPAGEPAGRVLFLDARGRARRDLEAAESARGWSLLLLRGSERPGEGPSTELPRERRERGGPPTLTVRGELLALLASGRVEHIEVALVGERVESPAANVIGVIRGVGTPQRPELAEQAIVFSAHIDHIGVDERAAPDADAIFNGADDDASGCAAVLELAEAFAAGPPPARTLVFLLATGEEIGLVGTHHYLEHPTVPLARTVCNLNFEMIGRPDALAGGPGRLWLTGFERSNLGPAFAEAGLALVPDPRPDQNFFQRSDNYAFALRGIVAQTLSSYDLHEDYHKVSDEPDTLDWSHLEAAVQAAWIGARALADGSIDPAWAPGGMPVR